MGLIYERRPLGEIKGKKKKKRGGGAMGPRAHEGCAPSPPWPATPLSKGTLVPHC